MTATLAMLAGVAAVAVGSALLARTAWGWHLFAGCSLYALAGVALWGCLRAGGTLSRHGMLWEPLSALFTLSLGIYLGEKPDGIDRVAAVLALGAVGMAASRAIDARWLFAVLGAGGALEVWRLWRRRRARRAVAVVQAQVVAACELYAARAKRGPVTFTEALAISAACGLTTPIGGGGARR